MDDTNIITVTTASGRVYDIDLDNKAFRTTGDQKFGNVTPFGVVDGDDPHHGWTTFSHLDVTDAGHLYILEPSGDWRKSTRVVHGLPELIAALDG